MSARAARLWGVAAAAVSAAALAGAKLVWASGAPEPEQDTVYTSTRQVTAMAEGPDGSLWAATPGGLVWRDSAGVWRKQTRLDGLPSHEARRLCADKESISVQFPACSARLEKGAWRIESLSSEANALAPCEATWRGRRYVSSRGAFGYEENGRYVPIPLPSSPGTHVSALLARQDSLWAALYGDGVWSFDGASWKRVDNMAPHDITALCDRSGIVWAGTRRGGVWELRHGAWEQHLFPDEPYAHNAQHMAVFRDQVFVSTLEDGLVVRKHDGWSSVRAPVISSDAPRQMVEFQGRLYVRHGGGKVDVWDGARWELDITRKLKRREVAAVATDGERLFAAQWGGWSEFDGREWRSRLDLAALQGVPTTAILPDGDTVWIGTQGRGLAECSRKEGTIAWHDARHGLTDDWITALAEVDGTLCAGTFVGGLARRTGGKWVVSLAGENVTGVEPDRAGGGFVSTRAGLWRLDRSGRLIPVAVTFLDAEVQCLLRGERGLWAGARTGIFYVADSTLSTATARR